MVLWIDGVTGFCSLTVPSQFLRKCKQITCILLLYFSLYSSSTVKANRKKKKKPNKNNRTTVIVSVSLFKPYNLSGPVINPILCKLVIPMHWSTPQASPALST